MNIKQEFKDDRLCLVSVPKRAVCSRREKRAINYYHHLLVGSIMIKVSISDIKRKKNNNLSKMKILLLGMKERFSPLVSDWRLFVEGTNA